MQNMVDSDRSKRVQSDDTIKIQNFPFSWKLWWKKLPNLAEYSIKYTNKYFKIWNS